MVYILFNPLSNNRNGTSASTEVKELFKDYETKVEDITKIQNVGSYVVNMNKEDIVVVCGGDGTIQRFANQVYDLPITQKIYYYPSGTGNDFAHDLEIVPKYMDKLFEVNEYIKNLPTVIINGERKHFINGIGFGIDGYCCSVGDEMRANSLEKINYTSIAIKGLLGKFKPCGGTVTVDGVEKKYRKIWLAPSMVGRYYGGGMMVAPNQDRLNAEKKLTSVVWHKSGKLSTLMKFPSIFTGKHVKYNRVIEIREGHEITVVFNKPQSLQIDGETVNNVNCYSVIYK